MLYNSIIVLVYRYKGEDYMKTVKIGLLGIGNVGSGAFQIFRLTQPVSLRLPDAKSPFPECSHAAKTKSAI